MKLEISPSEANLLQQHLTRRIESLDAELVRTDQHTLQHELAQDIESLRMIARRLRDAINDGASELRGH